MYIYIYVHIYKKVLQKGYVQVQPFPDLINRLISSLNLTKLQQNLNIVLSHNFG